MSRLTTALAALTLVATAGTAMGGSHLWRFNEIFSNHDGTVMFIELKECCGAGNETGLNNKDITSANLGNSFLFPANLPCSNCTANEHLLLATAGFAALPGAPTPDYIIPDGFFDVSGDTLTYWFYGDATWTFGAVPTCGQLSLNGDDSTGVNSPTNFAGETGSITAPCKDADFDFSCGVEVGDLLTLLSVWGCIACPDQDLDNNGTIGIGDLLLFLSDWGPCDEAR